MSLYTKTRNFHHQLAILGKLLTVFALFFAAFAISQIFSQKPPSHIEIGDLTFDYLIPPAAIRYQIKQQLIKGESK